MTNVFIESLSLFAVSVVLTIVSIQVAVSIVKTVPKDKPANKQLRW